MMQTEQSKMTMEDRKELEVIKKIEGNNMKGMNERLLYEILNDAYPGQWISEHKGIEGRKFRFDCANPSLKIAIEIEGGLWMNGKHNRPLGYIQNMEKYNLAVLEGWKILRYASETLNKTPYKIIRDIRTLCGASNETSQTLLCFDDASTGMMQVQRKL